MPEISKITLPNNTTYDIKDTTARTTASSAKAQVEALKNIVDALNSFSYIVCTTAADIPNATSAVVDDNQIIIGTKAPSKDTMYKIYLVPFGETSNNVFKEWITVHTDGVYKWEQFGSTEFKQGDLGALAYKDNASTTYTPQGTISTPTISVTLTKDTQKYLATSASGGGSATPGTAASCTLPVFSTSVSDEALTLSWSAGSFTPNTPTEVTMPSFTQTIVATGVASATSTKPTFTGTEATITVA